MTDQEIEDGTLEALAHDLIVMRETRNHACLLFDRQEAGLLHALRKAGKKEIRYDRFVIRRKTIPTVACWTCGAPTEEQPDWIGKHKAERLEITVKLEKAS